MVSIHLRLTDKEHRRLKKIRANYNSYTDDKVARWEEFFILIAEEVKRGLKI